MKFNNERPIYLQLYLLLALDIVTGKYEMGSKLPSVREIANMYKVNPNTAFKALSELERVNLIYTERTNGKFVTKDKKVILNYLNGLAKEKTSIYLSDMRSLGFSDEEIIQILKRSE